MSTFTVFALIVLPILGGLIAWAGDVIGYRLGKSRRSLLGLRPRTTARLVGVVVGILLPLATMLVAAAGSADVRTALLHFADLQQNNVTLKQENNLLAGSVESSRKQKERADTELAAAQTQLREAQTRLIAVRSQLTAAQALLRTTQAQLQDAQAQRDRANRELAKASQDLKTSQGNLTRAQQDEKKANAKLTIANAKVDDLKATQRGLQKQVDDLTPRAEQAQRDYDEAVRHLKATNETLAAKTEQLQSVEKQLNAAVGGAVRLSARSIYTEATGEVRYEPGTELMRTTIGARQSQNQLENSLRELEVVASKKAEALGVQAPEAGLAVRLIMPVPPGTAPGALPDEDALVRMVAQDIRESGAEQCVAVIGVTLRSFVGDNRPVAAELSIHPNTLVYPRGTVIVHRVIDGSRPRGQVLLELWGPQGGGLLSDLREASQQAGLMRDPKSGTYGQVSPEELLKALDELVASKRPMEVEAVAAQDVWVDNEVPFVATLKVAPPTEEQGGE